MSTIECSQLHRQLEDLRPVTVWRS